MAEVLIPKPTVTIYTIGGFPINRGNLYHCSNIFRVFQQFFFKELAFGF